jgi:hypothetical protein
MSLIFTPLFN